MSDPGEPPRSAGPSSGHQPAAPTPPTAPQLKAAADTFDLLSAPTRLHLVWLLARHEYDVGTLAEHTGATVAAVSQHLAKLRLASLVTARRDGRRQIYAVEDPHVLTLIEQIFEHIAPDGSLAPDPPTPTHPSRRPPAG
ncbi:ArsR/SmtB family transcription factor [Actinopolymorpha alba]|uniref:ArsR/SmtB family transcription factor n=1 Tax=Actinopolymorpha alba TaxID=533267 RepID=UPI00058DE577|nr:metalloregulator ArsR/SmtB family transcription factor [Actinopolymorpha alba]